MKFRDYQRSIDVLEAEMDSVMEQLDKLDPTTKEYEMCVKNLKTLNTNQMIKVRSRNEHLSGLIPYWGTWIGGAVLSTVAGIVYLKVERTDGIPPINAVNFWDKFRPKG